MRFRVDARKTKIGGNGFELKIRVSRKNEENRKIHEKSIFLYSGSLVALCPGFAKIKQNGFLSRKISPIFFVVAAGLSISPVRCCCEWFHSLCQECSSLVVAA